LRAHRHTFDKWTGIREVHPTTEVVWADELAVPDEYRRHSAEYAPTARLSVNWAIDGLDIDPSAYAFVDIGSGLGRALAVAAQYPFREVLGIEMDARLAAKAQENLDALPPDRCKALSVSSRAANALECDLPDMPAVFYLFNPFDREIADAFLKTLKTRDSHAAGDIILFQNLQYETLLADHGYQPLPLKARSRLLAAAFSPYSMKAFAGRPN
jgi:SAM-dependent methyltransferase